MTDKQQLTEIRPGRKIAIDSCSCGIEGTPTIFLIHGSSGNPAQWRDLLPELRPGFNCVVPSLLGHGSSQAPPFTPGGLNPYDFKEMAKDIQALVEKFGAADGNNILLGHSHGAMLATHLAYAHPKLVKRLVLLCPDTFKNNPKYADAWRQPAAELEALRPQLEEAFIQLAFCDKTSRNIIEQETAAARRVPMHVVQGMKLDLTEHNEPDFAHIKTPTLILLGDSDLIISNDRVRACYDKMPHHTITMIKDAGHLLMVEQPQAVMEQINKFLSG